MEALCRLAGVGEAPSGGDGTAVPGGNTQRVQTPNRLDALTAGTGPAGSNPVRALTLPEQLYNVQTPRVTSPWAESAREFAASMTVRDLSRAPEPESLSAPGRRQLANLV